MQSNGKWGESLLFICSDKSKTSKYDPNLILIFWNSCTPPLGQWLW